MNRYAASTIAALAFAACGGPTIDRPDGGPLFEIDAGVFVPDPPRWDVRDIDTRTPYGIATLRGRSDARHVIIEGLDNPVHRRVLPDGTFCIDLDLGGPGSYVFTAIGLDGGERSGASDPITIEFDPNAPDLPQATTCSGDHPAACLNAVEICGNMRDDDCNSLIDEEDPTCAICTNDPFEPNDDPSAPQVEPGTITDLQLCPDDVDYYGVFADENQTITARILFFHSEGNLDLILYGPNRTKVIAQSLSDTNNETITHTATQADVYSIEVSAERNVSNSYTLELEVN
ncbi:MAG: PPC domain-containing protein [Deltaproteobacteria bacterium]|jgi:hypothetical protein